MRQSCSACGRATVELFLTTRCDYCDFGPQCLVYVGYVVIPSLNVGDVEAYVFKTTDDAKRWRQSACLGDAIIARVESLERFDWMTSTFFQNMVIAKEMYEIFPDHRYEPKPCRVFLSGVYYLAGAA